MERLIVFALVFLLPTQLAYHFWPQFSYIHGLRVDYLSPAIYLTDILIVLLLPYIKKRLYLLLLPIIIFALVNCVFAQIPIVALLKWIVVFKLVVLGLYFYSCDLHMLKKTIVSALSLSLAIIFLIGLLQFIFQKTIGGPLYLLGERSFTSLTPGISLMNFFGKSLMRAYSTFSHPNSFAGFVVVSFLITLSFKSKRRLFLFVVVALSLLLTLSLNAIIGVFLVIILFFVMNNFPKIVEKTKAFLPLALIGLSLLFAVASSVMPLGITVKESYKERVVLAGKAIEAFSNDTLPVQKSGVSLQRRMTYQRSIHLRSKLRSVFECCYKPMLGVGLNNFFFAT
ncbi:MAG: hypothetical protein NTV24_03015, partial [Candidatus Woesebacteria bacterium]|nr:hypothetical protein [Candidatus Woesebacteria bacterium]